MLKLTQQEKKYVEAALALPKTYLGNIFFDCSEDSIASLSDDIEKTLSQRKDARNAWIIASRHAGKEASKKIWRGEQKAVEDLESSLRKEVHRSGIKCWLAENMIFQIHRPDTVGNK